MKCFVTENKLIIRFTKTDGKFAKEMNIKKMSFTSFQRSCPSVLCYIPLRSLKWRCDHCFWPKATLAIATQKTGLNLSSSAVPDMDKSASLSQYVCDPSNCFPPESKLVKSYSVKLAKWTTHISEAVSAASDMQHVENGSFSATDSKWSSCWNTGMATYFIQLPHLGVRMMLPSNQRTAWEPVLRNVPFIGPCGSL